MQRFQAFKFVLNPNGEQRRQMRGFAGSCRFVYNKALELQKEWYEKDSITRFSYTMLANLLPKWKKEFPWLKDAPSQALQQSLKDLERAYKNFFEKRAKFPRFKKKGFSVSFRYPQGVKLDEANSRIFLPKLGWIRYRKSRNVLGTIKNVTVSYSAGKWYVSIQTERIVDIPWPQTDKETGIDRGVRKFVTLSDGTQIEPLNPFRKLENALRKAQQSLSRKVPFSKNWHKDNRKVALIHTRIANSRRDFLHKTSTRISKSHAFVAVEDLRVKNMTGSASGTMESPGRNVRAKSGLNKSILDQGWGIFDRQMEYKMELNGGDFIRVPPHYTSQTCPECNCVDRENRKLESFLCISCGYANDADVVAAINVLKLGRELLDLQGGTRLKRLSSEWCSKTVSSRNPPKRPGMKSVPGTP